MLNDDGENDLVSLEEELPLFCVNPEGPPVGILSFASGDQHQCYSRREAYEALHHATIAGHIAWGHSCVVQQQIKKCARLPD